MVDYLPNGQWVLNKSADEPAKPSIHNLMGKTHTVEVHPHIDQLYRVKGLIQNRDKPHMQLGDIKRAGISEAITKTLPRDARGRVTPEMIDKHIEKLPKQKVQIKVASYDMGAQQHRRDVPQYVASVGFHPDTLKGMDDKHKRAWEHIKGGQHDLGGHEDQIGWARIDPHKIDSKPIDYDKHGFTEPGKSAPNFIPNDKHWHIDEIQSDFGNKDKIKDRLELSRDAGHHEYEKAKNDPKHPMREDYEKVEKLHDPIKNVDWAHPQIKPQVDAWQDAYRSFVNKAQAMKEKEHKEKGITSEDDMHKLLSHGHEDPQHLVHSAINQLGRQHGIESTSMDTPEDQARQSHLRENEYDDYEHDNDLNRDRWIDQRADYHHEHFTPEKVKKDIADNPAFNKNKYLHSAIEKVPHDVLRELITTDPGYDDPAAAMRIDIQGLHDYPTIRGYNRATYGLNKLNNQEIDALAEYLGEASKEGPQLGDYLRERPQEQDDSSKAALPVHQINTYDKRPKKLGMYDFPKSEIMGKHPNEDNATVQYGRLYKKLKQIQNLLKIENSDG